MDEEFFGCTAVEGDFCEILNPDEKRVIHDERGLAILARIKAMSRTEFDYFQAHRPRKECIKHYIETECPWIAESIYLLGTRLGRKPTLLEEAVDYRDKNAARFRVYYALRYPEQVEIPNLNRLRAS